MRDDPGTYTFDGFRLAAERGALLGLDGVELRLRPKTFALLRYLVDHPGRLLGREELLEVLWPGVAVTDDSLTQCVGELRQAFGSRAAQILRTVPRRGYMLTAAVQRDGPPRQDADRDAGLAPKAALLPSRDIVEHRQDPVAIHRFEAPDGDPACARLADALAGDLIAELARAEGLRVLPAAEAAAAGYRIQGEVRSVGEGLRVTLRLEEAATGTVFWAERLDQPREAASGLSAATLSALGAHIDWQVERHSHSAARRKPVATLTARELCLIGRDHHQRITQADTEVAREMFAQAIATDPDYAPAYAWQAYTVHRAITHGWGSPAGQAARDEALRLARRAVQLQPDSPLCLARLAFALVLDQRWEEAVDVARSALRTGRPAFAPSRITVCEVLVAAGHSEEAVEVAQAAIALDPLCPPTARGILGRALLLAGRVEESLPPLRWCALHLPDYAATYDTLVVAWAEAGRMPEALAARRELFRLRPDWMPRNHTGFWYFRRAEDLARFQAAHRRVAGQAGSDGAPPVTAAELPGPGPSHAGAPPEPPELPRAGPGRPPAASLAGLRQDTLVIQPLRSAPADAAAAQAAAALAPSLMAELVRHPDLRVVAGPDQRVSQGFEVRGDVHSAGDLLRAHLRLDDLVTGTTFWAGQVEWPAGRTTGLPVGDIASLAATMNAQIGRKSLRRARQKPVDRLSARELTLLGQEHYLRSTEAETSVARGLFLRATEADPGYAPALAWTAITLARIALHGWRTQDLDETLEQSIRLARMAVELDPESPHSLASLGLALALQGHWEEAVTTARLALRTSRIAGDAALIASGDTLAAAGYPEEAERAFRQAIARDPYGSPVLHAVLGRALLLEGRPEEAMAALRHCAVHLPDYALCFRTMVVAAVEAGLVEEAREALRDVARLRPDWVAGTEPIFWFLRRPEDVERYGKAFRIARRLGAAADAGGLMPAPTARA
ncbi:winged helix-turn-helix domain-containing protein [Roseomonas sp. OT10]|uniref:winged helix-turn-helix domain-containing protein n=1 Tax=Roseomonas cutis TaxID=2897332 RepID=UPI001E304350|nr:winged helix-turn-helix domain-containing protein [Roseomonas sp. OT10]UFN50088.1 winged helix-turn-helix domain-containing protein [Roseomonas sp. OT10]